MLHSDDQGAVQLPLPHGNKNLTQTQRPQN